MHGVTTAATTVLACLTLLHTSDQGLLLWRWQRLPVTFPEFVARDLGKAGHEVDAAIFPIGHNGKMVALLLCHNLANSLILCRSQSRVVKQSLLVFDERFL